MKYKHLAILMGVMITATSVGSTATAFAADSKTESTQDADDTTEDTAEASDEKADDSKEETNENEILGEVKSVEDGKITIAVGTRKEMSQPGEQPQGGENSEAPEKPDGDDAKADGDAKGSKDADSEKTDDASTDESSDTDEETEDTESTDDASADNTDKGEAPDGNGDGQGAPDGEAPSMLDLTGEEQEITVTDSTVITKQSMGGGQEHLVEKLRRNRMEILPMTMQMQNRKILMIQKRQMHLTAKNQTEKPRTVTARHQMVQARPKRLH